MFVSTSQHCQFMWPPSSCPFFFTERKRKRKKTCWLISVSIIILTSSILSAIQIQNPSSHETWNGRALTGVPLIHDTQEFQAVRASDKIRQYPVHSINWFSVRFLVSVSVAGRSKAQQISWFFLVCSSSSLLMQGVSYFEVFAEKTNRHLHFKFIAMSAIKQQKQMLTLITFPMANFAFSFDQRFVSSSSWHTIVFVAFVTFYPCIPSLECRACLWRLSLKGGGGGGEMGAGEGESSPTIGRSILTNEISW